MNCVLFTFLCKNVLPLVSSAPCWRLCLHWSCVFSFSPSRLAAPGAQTAGWAWGMEESRHSTQGKHNDETVWIVPYDGTPSLEVWGNTSWSSSVQNARKKNKIILSSKKTFSIRVWTRTNNLKQKKCKGNWLDRRGWRRLYTHSSLAFSTFGESLGFLSDLFWVAVSFDQTSRKTPFITSGAAPCSPTLSHSGTYSSLACKPTVTESTSKLLPSERVY